MRTFKLFLIGLCIVLLTIYCFYVSHNNIVLLPISEQELIKLEAEVKNPTNELLRRVFVDLDNFKIQKFRYISFLNNRLKQLVLHRDFSDLQLSTLENLEQQRLFYQQLNSRIDKALKDKINYIPYSLSTNQMDKNIYGAKALIRNNFEGLLSGSYLMSINNQKNNSDFLIVSSEKSHWLATSKATFLTTALLSILSKIEDDFKLQLFDPSGIYGNAEQLFKLPKSLFSKLMFEFDNKNLIFSDLTPVDHFEIVVTHNGYAFGGNRVLSELEEIYFKNNPDFQDCTSWLKKLLQSEAHFITLDLLYLHRRNLGYGVVNENWISTPAHKALQKLLEPVKVNSIKDLKPGMVFAVREFKFVDALLGKKDKKRGNSGHVGVIVGVNYINNTFLLASYSRNMPQIDGPNIRSYAFEEAFNARHLYFRVKSVDKIS